MKVTNKELQEHLKQFPDDALLEIQVDSETCDLGVTWVDGEIFHSKKNGDILLLTIGVKDAYKW